MKVSRAQVNTNVIETSIELAPGIPLNVYLVKGKGKVVFIDSGIQPLHGALMQTLAEAGFSHADLAYVLNTHSHHDHIGGNGQLLKATGCKIIAPRTYRHWHSDFERHYQEFARSFPGIFEDTAELRSEVMDILDEPHPVHEAATEGMLIDLGAGTVLEGISFSGHMMEEFGWLDRHSATLILGDVITLMDAPFIHGHVTVSGYRESLDKLARQVKERGVKQVLMAHFPPMDRQQFDMLLQQAHDYLLKLEKYVFEAVRQGNGALETIWRTVCEGLNKKYEFRSLATVHAHLEDLVAKQRVRQVAEQRYEIDPASSFY